MTSRTAVPWRTVVLAAGLAFGLCAAGGAQAGVITASILSVDLKNPVVAAGNGVSQITFSFASNGIGRLANIGTEPADISVSSMPGINRYVGVSGEQAGLRVSFATTNAVNLTLTPLRVYRPNENVRFTFRVRETNTIRIPGRIVFGSTVLTEPPAWFDNSTPAVQLNPGPKLPGFKVITRDAEYIAYNDLDTAFATGNLQYFPDITQTAFDSIDLDAVLAEPPTTSPIVLSPDGGTFVQTGLADPQPDDLFAVTGQIIDPTDDFVLGSFKEAVVTAAPTPGPLALTPVWLVALASVKRLRLYRYRVRR